MPRRTQKHAKRPAVVVGKIYANWCGHCTALAPEWAKMKSQLKHKHPKMVFEEIEQSDQAVKLNRVNRIYMNLTAKPVELQDGYPTIFKIVKGKVSYYNGSRTADAMVQWVESHNGGVDDIKTNIMGGKKKSAKRRRSNKTCKKCKSVFSFFS